MGNFLTNDPTGAAIGLGIGNLLGKLWKQNWDNRSYEKAYRTRQEQLGVNNNDYGAANQRLLDESGHGSLVGQSPDQTLLNNKQKWAEYEQAANGLNQQLGAAQASGNQGLITSLMEQMQQNQTKMDGLHKQSDFIRQLGANKGWDLSGYGANDTLGAAQAKYDGTAALSNQIGNNSKLVPNSEGLLSGLGLVKRIDDTPKEKMPGLLESLGWTKPEENAERGNKTISADDLSQMLLSDPKTKAEYESYAQASRDARVKDPGFLSSLEAGMRKQSVDPGIMQGLLIDTAQTQQRNEIEELMKQAYSTNDPRIANEAMLKIQMLGRPDLFGTYAQSNATPKDEWRFNTQKNAWEIKNGYRKEAAEDNFTYTQADKDANVGRQQVLDTSQAGLQVDTAGKMAEINRFYNNASIADRIKWEKEYPGLFTRSKKLPSYANDADDSFNKALQAIDGGDIAKAGEYADKLEVLMGRKEVDDADRARIKTLWNVINARRELAAGYGDGENFWNYISDIPEEERKKYGLPIYRNNVSARAPKAVSSATPTSTSSYPRTPYERTVEERSSGNTEASVNANAVVDSIKSAIQADGTLDYDTLAEQGISKAYADLIYSTIKAKG